MLRSNISNTHNCRRVKDKENFKNTNPFLASVLVYYYYYYYYVYLLDQGSKDDEKKKMVRTTPPPPYCDPCKSLPGKRENRENLLRERRRGGGDATDGERGGVTAEREDGEEGAERER